MSQQKGSRERSLRLSTPHLMMWVREGWQRLPMPAQVLVALLAVAFLFYLPFLNILPFAYIRTDISAAGTDWASVLYTIAN